jgi:glycosyltransferase involved in cell wall biosynthesis
MLLSEVLTVVIPCKNEESYIGKLLDDLEMQNDTQGLRIIIADGNSTDMTMPLIKRRAKMYEKIKIDIIKGGSVSIGRNRGLNLTTTPYIVFIDADTRLFHKSILTESVKTLKRGFQMVGAPIKCYKGDIRTLLFFKFFNFFHKYYIKFETFCVGQFCMVETQLARNIGGFDETVHHSEDFLFSRTIPTHKFTLIKYYVGQDDRRFKKMGYFRFILFLVNNFIFKNNIKTFRKNVNYW